MGSNILYTPFVTIYAQNLKLSAYKEITYLYCKFNYFDNNDVKYSSVFDSKICSTYYWLILRWLKP